MENNVKTKNEEMLIGANKILGELGGIDNNLKELTDRRLLMGQQMSQMTIGTGVGEENADVFKKIEHLTEDEIEDMIQTKEGREEFLKIFEGTSFIVAEAITDPKEKIEFYADIAKFHVSSIALNKEMDELTKNFIDRREELYAEMNEVTAEIGDISELVKKVNRERLELIEVDEKLTAAQKEQLSTMLNTQYAAIGFAETLDNVIDFYQNGPCKIANVKRELSDAEAHAKAAKRFKELMRQNKMTMTIFKYPNFEQNFGDEFKGRENELVFLVSKMIAGKTFLDKSKDLVFLSQLSVNMQKIKSGVASEREKETMRAGMAKLFNLFA